MITWTKRETAKFLGISSNALDHWIDRGCPANRNSEGRISGLNINEVILWASAYQSREVQRRAQAAIPRLIALVTTTAAVQSVNGVDVLREAGLTKQAANDAWLVIESRAAKHAFEFVRGG